MGLRTTGGTQGVGVSTTRSVVVASVMILASDFFMTKVLLLAFPVS
jgi:phospholipid/cholesterol/gamma-HCH transport system permease protein